MERHTRLLRRIHQAAHTWDANTLATHVKWILDAEHCFWDTKPAGDSKEWREYEAADVADQQSRAMEEQSSITTQKWLENEKRLRGIYETRVKPPYSDDPASAFPPFVHTHRDPVSGKLVPDMPNVQDMVMRSAFENVVKRSTPIVDHLRCNPIPMVPIPEPDHRYDPITYTKMMDEKRKRDHGIVRCLCPLNFIHMKNQHDVFQEAVNKGLSGKYFGMTKRTDW
jgi:hypothetical protein